MFKSVKFQRCSVRVRMRYYLYPVCGEIYICPFGIVSVWSSVWCRSHPIISNDRRCFEGLRSNIPHLNETRHCRQPRTETYKIKNLNYTKVINPYFNYNKNRRTKDKEYILFSCYITRIYVLSNLSVTIIFCFLLKTLNSFTFGVIALYSLITLH